MKRIMLICFILVTLFLPGVSASRLMAQGVGPSQGTLPLREKGIAESDSMEKEEWLSLWKRIQEIRLSRLKETLHLNEDQVNKFLPKLRTLDEKKRKLGKERLFLLRQLKGERPSQGTVPLRDGTTSHLNAIEANSAALTEVRTDIQVALKNHLTPEQQVQYILFQQKFKKELRGLIQSEKKTGESQ